MNTDKPQKMGKKTDKPQILLINDMVGHSKVGMGAMVPIFSYMGFPTFSLPTAIISNTFDYGQFSVLDTTDYIRQTLPVWKSLGFSADAICTGCMLSEEQAQLVASYCREESARGTRVFVDPILGDGGRLYNGMTQQQVNAMRAMVSVADLIFPNYTEAALLTGHDFKQDGLTWSEAQSMLNELRAIGCQSALITSCPIDGKSSVAGYDHQADTFFLHRYDEIPGIFHGTGDLFSAILIVHLLSGETLEVSTRRAMDTVYRLIYLNRDLDDRCQGILVEQFLSEVKMRNEK